MTIQLPRTVAIGQPTYLPWIGWFDILDQVDEFVVLDSVQFERHSWQHRNRLAGPNGEIMLIVPVRRSGLDTPICRAEIADRRAVANHFVTMSQTYARAAFGAMLLSALQPIYEDVPELLVDLNLRLIDAIAALLEIDTPRVRSSEMSVDGTKEALVLSICQSLRAEEYLANPGSRGYLSSGTSFSESGVAIRYHSYECQRYDQPGSVFMPFMSAVDVVARVGPADARKLMVSGRRSSPE